MLVAFFLTVAPADVGNEAVSKLTSPSSGGEAASAQPVAQADTLGADLGGNDDHQPSVG